MNKFGIVFFLATALIAVYAVEVDEKVTEECKKQLNIQGDVPVAQKSCVCVCTKQKTGVITTDFSINVDKMKSTMANVSTKDAPKYATVLTTCQNAGKGKDMCGAAAAIENCLRLEANKIGIQTPTMC